MSEKLYRFLLSLYPSRFRSRYEEEAMQLFRDRLRDERGAFQRTRLWLDILRDLFVSAPREHRRAPAHPAPVAGAGPSFLVLEEEPLRPPAFLIGAAMALLAVGAFSYLLSHGGNRVLFPAVSNEPLRSAMAPAVDASATQKPAAPDREGAADQLPPLTAAERALVIRRVVGAAQKYDPSPAESRALAEMLEQQQSFGKYDGIVSGPAFAELLTQQVDGLARHLTLTVLCGQQPLPGSPIWAAPAHPGARAWLRIDDHFSVVAEPVTQSTETE